MRRRVIPAVLGALLVIGAVARAAGPPPGVPTELSPDEQWAAEILPEASVLGVPRAFTEDQALRARESFLQIAGAIWTGNFQGIPEPVRLAWQHFGLITQIVGPALQVVGFDERAPRSHMFPCQSLLAEVYEARPWRELTPLVGKSSVLQMLPKLKAGQKVRIFIYLPKTVIHDWDGNPLPRDQWITPRDLGWVRTFRETTTLTDELRQPPTVLSGCPAFPIVEEWPVKKAGP